MLQSRPTTNNRDRPGEPGPAQTGPTYGGATTTDPDPDSAGIARVLREQIGVDPNNPSVVLNLAAIGITNGTWRNSPLEDWHGEGRIHDGGMLRANVATTKLVRGVLTDHLGKIVGHEGVALTAIEDLADLGRLQRRAVRVDLRTARRPRPSLA